MGKAKLLKSSVFATIREKCQHFKIFYTAFDKNERKVERNCSQTWAYLHCKLLREMTFRWLFLVFLPFLRAVGFVFFIIIIIVISITFFLNIHFCICFLFTFKVFFFSPPSLFCFFMPFRVVFFPFKCTYIVVCISKCGSFYFCFHSLGIGIPNCLYLRLCVSTLHFISKGKWH